MQEPPDIHHKPFYLFFSHQRRLRHSPASLMVSSFSQLYGISLSVICDPQYVTSQAQIKPFFFFFGLYLLLASLLPWQHAVS